MNSREKLQELIDSAFGCDIMYYQDKYEKEIKLYNELMKELILIELIKPMINIVENKKTTERNYVVALSGASFYNDETLKLIKEWLDNDVTI